MPLILTLGFSTLTGLFDVSLSGGVLSSILSIILFLSILPVLRASETLPRKKLEARKMKEHIELANSSKNPKPHIKTEKRKAVFS
jgi:hypothetical protein